MKAKRIKQLRIYILERAEAMRSASIAARIEALECVSDERVRGGYALLMTCSFLDKVIPIDLQDKEHEEYITFLNAVLYLYTHKIRAWKRVDGPIYQKLKNLRSSLS